MDFADGCWRLVSRSVSLFSDLLLFNSSASILLEFDPPDFFTVRDGAKNSRFLKRIICVFISVGDVLFSTTALAVLRVELFSVSISV